MTVYQQLLDNGPLPMIDMSVRNRMKGVAKFNAGHLSVWYIIDEHSKEDVIQAWLDVNGFDKTSMSIYMRVIGQGPQWKEPAKEVFDVSRKVPGGRSHETKTCPLCDEDDIPRLADHLPTCPDR